MGTQIFVWFEGGVIPAQGETTDPFFRTKRAFEVQSFSSGAENPTSIGSASGGASAGKAKLTELTLLKRVDNVSPSLFRATTTGTHFPTMVLAVRTGNNVFLIYTFSLVYVTRVQTVGSQGEAPLEEVTLAYGAQQIRYFPQRPDGTLGPPNDASWNQVTNSPNPGFPT